MISIGSIKQIIMTELVRNGDIPWLDRMILAAVIYVNYNNLLRGHKSNASFNMKEFTTSQISLNMNKLNELKESTTTYGDIERYIISTKKENILSFSEYDFKIIHDLFNQFIEKESFSINNFSVAMYNVSNLPRKYILRLEKIHHNVMAPMMRYYMNEFNVHGDDMSILNIYEVETNPGRIVTFKIKNVSPIVIVHDLKRNKLGLSKFVIDAYLSKDAVSILLKI